MRWHRVRFQVLCSVAVVILLFLAFLTSAADTQTTEALQAPTVEPVRLAQLHAEGTIKQKQHQQAVLAAAIAAQNPDCTKLSCIALTFDDGPNPITTPQVVSVLEAEHVTGTFFMVGTRVAGNEVLLQRMHNDGDEIGNHSWSHPDLTKLRADQVTQQIVQTQAAITATGVPAPTLFRPPYGAINQTVRDQVKPLTLALWNEDPKDWAAHTSAQVLAASEASAKSGGVIDMHDIYHVTADALTPLIDNLKSRGFTFVTMSQLIGGQQTTDEFYGGYRP